MYCIGNLKCIKSLLYSTFIFAGFIGVNGTSSSCANGWEHTGAKPKSTVPGAPSSSVLDKKVSIVQSHVKGIHEQLSSGGGSSIGFSLHGDSNGDHLRDRTGTLRCVPPPPEHGGRQTTDHWLQQPQETPKLSLEPGKHCFFQKHFTHTY